MRDNKHPSFAAKSRGFTKLRKKVLSSKKQKKQKRRISQSQQVNTDAVKFHFELFASCIKNAEGRH